MKVLTKFDFSINELLTPLTFAGLVKQDFIHETMNCTWNACYFILSVFAKLNILAVT